MEHIFRQWDDHDKKFFYWGENLSKELAGMRSANVLPQIDLGDKRWKPSEQYVGFQDKDGQLVFVGDRFQFKNSVSEINFTIVWDKERCSFYGIADNGVDYHIVCLIQMMKLHGVGKVIGHIHQVKS